MRDDIPLIVISAGSIGCGPIRELALSIRQKSENSIYVAVLCGNNRKLLKELALLSDDRIMLPVPFTDKVHLWLAAADIMITKPGGLSSTEAATTGTPLILMDAVPGLETKNLEYFVENGCAISASCIEDLCKKTFTMLNDVEIKRKMMDKQSIKFHSDSSELLVNHIEGVLDIL